MHSKIKVIGLMSGTSFDGIDASLIETDGEQIYQHLGNHFLKYPSSLMKSYQHFREFNIEQLLEFERDVTILHCEAILEFCSHHKVKLEDIDLIGFHGQTLYHNIQKKLTLQVGNSNIITQKLGIDVVSDFRRRDIENGGQGAPLVPFYHRAIINDQYLPAAILNIGGVSNVTLLTNSTIAAFDTGPGNAKLDDLVRHFNDRMECDFGGEISSRGTANHNLINKILGDDYFKHSGPKSLDRNYFKLEQFVELGLHDGAATICELIAKTASDAIPAEYSRIYVCGGGRRNKTIMKRLSEISKLEVNPIEILGLDGDYIESQAFAYLAARIKYNLPISNKSTTGALTQQPGGAFYQA